MMNKTLSFYLHDLELSKLESIEINEFKSQVDFEYPDDYLYMIGKYNNSEGEIGENSYLVLFPFEDLRQINGDYAFLMDEIPDYFLFGKDAADTGYAFHKRKHTYHSFGLMSNFKTDSIEFCGNTFLEFLDYLYRY